MSTKQRAYGTIAALRMSNDEADLERAYLGEIEASFRAFLLRFRMEAGRFGLTAQEHSLARLAHCSGFVDGADLAFGAAESTVDLAEADGDGEGER